MNPKISLLPHASSKRSFVLAALAASMGAQSHGALIYKADNGDSLVSGSSWIGGVVPGPSDIAVFDSTVNSSSFSSFAMPFPASLEVDGLQFIDNKPGLIFDAFFNGGLANVLTIGSAGIDMSAGGVGTTVLFDNPTIALRAGTVPSIRVEAGRTLEFFGPLSRTNSGGIRYQLGVNNAGVVKVDDTSWGASGAVTAHSTIQFTGDDDNPADGISFSNDFAAIGTSGGFRQIAPGRAVAVYTPNPNTGTALPSISGTYAVLDVVNSNTNATTAFRMSNALTVAGIRFDQPHATGLNWTVDVTSGRNLNIGNGGILVGANVGAKDVVFNNSGNIRFSQNQDFYIHQHNTAGNLVLNSPMNQSAGVGARMTKLGPGRVILASSGNSLGGTTTILEGTVQVGNGGTTGSINGGPVNNFAALALSRSDAWILSNVINGPGSLTHLGPGTATLSGLNTFTGPLYLNGGSLAFSADANLGSPASPMVFGGGALLWADGNTLDISNRSIQFASSTGTLNVGINSVTLGNPIGGGGTGGMNKAGTGTLTLAAANNYSGPTTVSAGTLVAANSSGSATGSGNVTLGASSTLAGNGTIAGTVTAGANSNVAPGVGGVGTLTVGGLTLQPAGALTFEFASTSSHDRLVTTLSNGLTLNGGGVRLLNAGSETAFTTPGTYDLVQYSGSVQGLGASAVSILNPVAGYGYTFSTASNFLKVSIALDSIISEWTSAISGSWANSLNWSNGVPGSGYSASFTTALAAPLTVSLDGNRSIDGAVFSSPNPYTIASGTGGSLTFFKPASTVGVNVNSGSHTISAPVSLGSTTGFSVVSGSSLDLSAAVSGTGGINKTGGGQLNLGGVNSFSGDINLLEGVLSFSDVSGLGLGALTINGGTLRFNAGNTADISNRTITFGLDNARFDTNGNNVTLSNSIGNSGVGQLIKVGAGELTLSGVNTHTGGTIINAGSLRLGGATPNDALGAAGSALTLNGGTLAAGTQSLPAERPLVVGTSGGSISVDSGSTLTLNMLLQGTGTLTKSGPGTLAVASVGTDRVGTMVLAGGSVLVSTINDFANTQSVLGVGPLSFSGGTLTSAMPESRTLILNNPLVIPEGQTGAFSSPVRLQHQGSVTLNGTLNMTVRSDVSRTDLMNAWSGNGTLNLLNGRAASAPTIVRLMSNNTPFFTAASFTNITMNLDNGVGLQVRTNSGGNTIPIGSLSGGAGGTLNGDVGGSPTYQIGGLNTSTTYAGALVQGVNNTGTHLTKVGTGTLTLSGVNTTAGNYTVNGGTLLLTNTNSNVTTTTVNAGATLGGTGTLGGTVNFVGGTLRTDATGTLGGELTFNGQVNLDAASTVTFDLGGMIFTKVQSLFPSGINYGGSTLRINIPGTIYNGTYPLFALTGAPSGAFGAALVTTGVTTDAALTVDGSVWSGTVDGASFSFNSTTGVLTISGGAAAVVPGTPTGLTAVPGNAQVSLSWTGGANTTSYRVLRSANSGSGFATIQTGVLTNSFVDTGLTNGTTYYYVVQAVNSVAVSGFSTEASATPDLILPDAPTGLNAVGGNAVVNLSWTAGANTTSFTVLRSTASDGVYAAIASDLVGTTYADTTAVNGTTYYYVVRGVNSGGTGPDSNIASATPESALTALEQWRLTHFGSSDNTGNGADNFDADGDGVVNLVEYATGTLPLVATSVAPPTVGISSNVLNLTFNRIADPTLIYTVRSAAELNTGWSPVAVFTSTGASNVAGPVTANDTTVVPAGGRRFLRLEVTY